MSSFSPRFVTEFDLGDVRSDFAPPPGYRSALVMIRHGSVPLGPVPVESLLPRPLAALRAAIETRLAVDETLIARARQQQEVALVSGPTISVVLCTKNREPQLRSCLEALAQQRYPRFEIVVVDNTSGRIGVRDVVGQFATSVAIRLVVEPLGGLSRARNRGASVAEGTVIAFIDDDAVPSQDWITELAAGYTSSPEAGAVNGAILPSEIETEAQEWYLEYGGHSKGRGFEATIIDPSAPGAQSPLYPLPPFGAGGNMSVRRDALLAAGGFDEALGAGTPARGAEETSLFTRLLLAGWPISYRPSAFVWHADRADYGALVGQMHALGTSLTAYYTSLVLRDPRLMVRLIGLLPRGIRDVRGGAGSLRTSTMSTSFPTELVRVNRRGMMLGPYAYIRSRWQCRNRPSALHGI